MRFIFFLTIFLFLFQSNNNILANAPDFKVWLENFKIEAEKKGISKRIIDESLDNVQLIPRVIELDRKQPEFTLTLNQYLNRVVTNKRITKGVGKLRENWDLLQNISKEFF